MLNAKEAAETSAEVKRVFGSFPDIHVRYRNGATLYEVQVFAPNFNNVGRGETLAGALQHLKEVSGRG